MANRLTVVMVLALVSSAAIPSYSQLKHGPFRRTHKSWLRKPLHITPVGLPSSRRLITTGDTLYLVDTHGTVIWKWDVGNGEDIMDRPYVDRHGNIFGIAVDGIVFSLDSTGKERWRWRMNGSYQWTQLKPYLKGQYLMVLGASAYRKFKGFDEDDVLYQCHDKEIISTVSFPRNAKLRLNGSQIFAVTKNRMRRVRLAAKTPNKSLDASGGGNELRISNCELN